MRHPVVDVREGAHCGLPSLLESAPASAQDVTPKQQERGKLTGALSHGAHHQLHFRGCERIANLIVHLVTRCQQVLQ